MVKQGPFSRRSRHDHHHACRNVRALRALLHVSLRTTSPHYRMLHIPPYPPFKRKRPVYPSLPLLIPLDYITTLQHRESQSAAPTDQLHTTRPIADRSRPSTASTNGYRPHHDTTVSWCGPAGLPRAPQLVTPRAASSLRSGTDRANCSVAGDVHSPRCTNAP